MALSQEKLLSIAALKEYSNLSGSFDAKAARIAVVGAQRSQLLTRIGNPLYQKLLTDVRDNPTPDVPGSAFTDPYLTLVTDFVQPFLLWATLLEILEENYLKISNNQLVRLSASTDSAPGSGAEYQQKRDILLRKMDNTGDILSEHLALEGQTVYVELADRPDILGFRRERRDYNDGPMFVPGGEGNFNDPYSDYIDLQ